MGYRSEVCAVFYCPKGDYPAMKLFMDENEPKDNELFDKTDIDHYEVVDLEDKMLIRYLFVDIKWYDGEGVFREFMEFMFTFEKITQTTSWNYEYIRIGEDYNDVHTLESEDNDHLIGVRREVEYNF